MATAPFQLWLDVAPIASAVRAGSAVTVTTTASHGIPTGAYIQMQGASATPGTSMNGVYEVTATSGTTFTYTSAGTAGTATVTSACISYDLMNPLINYSGTAKEQALYVDLGTMALGISGDGSGSSFGFTVMQDDTPAVGPWFNLIPDDARVRLVKKDTGSTPASDLSDLFFTGVISAIEVSMNGSGQGTRADLTLSDPTVLLERTVLYGAPISPRAISPNGGAVRASNVVTITTDYPHGYSVGQIVAISGVLGGGGTSFNGGFTIASVPSTTTFTYAQTGSNATSVTSLTPSSAARKANTVNVVSLTVSNHGLLGGGSTFVQLSGLTSSNAKVQSLSNATFSTDFGRMQVVDANTIHLLLATAVKAIGVTFNTTGSSLTSGAIVRPIQGRKAPTISFEIKAGEGEVEVITRAMSAVTNYKGLNAAFQRVFNTADVTQVTGNSAIASNTTLKIDPTTLRSFLDTIVEMYSGMDGKPRRYFVNTSGQLVYGLVDSSSAPAFATAPYSIITSGEGNYDTTTAKATLAAYELTATWSHDTVKQVVFSAPQAAAETLLMVKDYTQVGLTNRPTSALYDTQLDYPTTVKDSAGQINLAAKAYLVERHKPLLSGQFVLRGTGNVAHNEYGFNAGYAQTGASTFALVSRWLPNQWVEVTSAEMGFSGLYRVEQVQWSLEPGAFSQIITVTFNRRLPDTLTEIISRWDA